MTAHFKLALKYKNLFSSCSVSVNSEILSSDPSDEEIFIISFICVQYLVYRSSFFLKSKPSFFTRIQKSKKVETGEKSRYSDVSLFTLRSKLILTPKVNFAESKIYNMIRL